jgi:VIT1/CCC1 family predicted Fe2+/Mn2+ transporter
MAGLPSQPVLAVSASVTALFVTGAAKSRYSHRTWLRSGAEMVLVGLLGAAAGLVIGKLLSARG